MFWMRHECHQHRDSRIVSDGTHFFCESEFSYPGSVTTCVDNEYLSLVPIPAPALLIPVSSGRDSRWHPFHHSIHIISCNFAVFSSMQLHFNDSSGAGHSLMFRVDWEYLVYQTSKFNFKVGTYAGVQLVLIPFCQTPSAGILIHIAFENFGNVWLGVLRDVISIKMPYSFRVESKFLYRI